FRVTRLGEFLETRIVAERIEHRIEPEQRGSEWHLPTKRTFVWCREQLLQSSDRAVAFARSCRHPGQELAAPGTKHGIFLGRVDIYGALREGQRSRFVAEDHIGQGKIPNRTPIIGLFVEESLEFTPSLSPNFLGPGMIASDFLRPP